MISSLIGPHGFKTERVIAEAGARGIVIATRRGGRSLVSVARGTIDGSVLRERPGWDLPLESASEVEGDDGQFTVIVEALPTAVPSIDTPWPAGRVPAFVVDLASRMAEAHATGTVVGPLQPALVFVEPDGSRLAGVAQRPLRTDQAAAKPEGAQRLFPVSSLTPAEVRGEELTRSDDAYRLASMTWRWRHGEDRLARRSPAEQLAIIGGTAAVETLEGTTNARAEDDLDALLERMLDPQDPDRPGVEALVRALRAHPVAGRRS